MKRLALAIVIGGGLIAISPITYQNIGFSVQCINEDCIVQASTSLLAIGIGVLFFLATLLIPRHPFQPSSSLAAFSRLAGAFILDIYVFSVSFGALMMLLPIITESFYSGSFQWEYTRNFTRATDTLINIIAVALFLTLFLYFRYRTNQRRMPTVGQYLMGYVAEEGQNRLFEYR